MENKNTVVPIKSNERIAYLDILRGIAILFIFTANIQFFSGHWFFTPDSAVREINWQSDTILDFIVYVLVDGKFYSIFSLLFGIGCFIQYQNTTSKGKAFAPFFRKRMFWLLVFGLVHLFLIWPGDILALYAFLGFFLIGFVKASDKTLLITAGVLLLLPIANWAFMQFSGIFYPGFAFNTSTAIYQYFGMPVIESNGQLMTDIPAFLQNKNLADFFKMNLGNGFTRIGMLLEEGRLFKVFGVFLLGLWAGKKIIHHNLLNNISFLKKVLITGLAIGLPFNLLRGYLAFYTESLGDTLNYFLHVVTYTLGTVPLALGYAAGIALLCKKHVIFLKLFTPIGKTALTCYLSQSIIAILLFYGFGFNLTGKYGFTIIMIIAFCIFAGQVIISKIWLQYYKFGPMEWLWRKLTYGSNLKLRK
ncbi:MAG TPA: DUF418 domain-containing protein [Flavobacteriaceae bacterium]|nr:DUF418 domain-containing protein [Flavobacteriaceae bacterium]